jgi:hypothetical protein
MRLNRPRALINAIGLTAACGLAAGGTAGVVVSHAGDHAAARQAAHSAALRQSELSVRARTALLHYLTEGHAPTLANRADWTRPPPT